MLFAIITSCLLLNAFVYSQTNICAELKPCGDYSCESGRVGGLTFYFCNCETGFPGLNTTCPDPDPLCNPLCKNGGKCNDGKCTCPQPYTGLSCGTIIISQKKCDTITNFCQHGGTCRNDDSNSDGYVCECTNEYTGKNCEQIQENVCIRSKPCGEYKCEWLPRQSSYICYCQNNYIILNGNCSVAPTCSKRCQNSGSCTLDSDFKASCICSPGYTGEFCEIEVTVVTSPCDSGNPCRNGGSCAKYSSVFSPDRFYCICKAGFTGSLCEIATENLCGELTCENGGVCVQSVNGFHCKCESGYTGPTCETKVLCESNTCNGAGSCVIEKNERVYCICQNGFTGTFCETKLPSLCDQVNPCLNGGLCKSSIETAVGFECVCENEYSGPFCETPLPSLCDRMNPCINGGLCKPSSKTAVGFVCVCSKEFTGPFCEQTVL